MLHLNNVKEFNVNNWVDILCYTNHKQFDEIPENCYLSHSSLYERFYLLKRCYQQFSNNNCSNDNNNDNDSKIYALVNELFKRDYLYENFKEFWRLLYSYELKYATTVEPKFLLPYTIAFFNNLSDYLLHWDNSSKNKVTSTMVKFIEQSIFIADIITLKNRFTRARNRKLINKYNNTSIESIINVLKLLDKIISQLYVEHPKIINYLHNFCLKTSTSTLLTRAFEINKEKLSYDFLRGFYEDRYEIFTKKTLLNNEQMISLIKSLKYISSLKAVKSFAFTDEQHQLIDALLTIKNSKKLIHTMANKGSGRM